jgi:molybdenum cofactor biosynthesis protein B
MGEKDRCMSVAAHKKDAPRVISLGIITVSTSRSLADDESGDWISRAAAALGHEVIYHQVVTDEKNAVTHAVTHVIGTFSPQVLLLTGGTGITSRDITVEAVSPLFEKTLSAFGPIFALLSYQEISSAAILSRASAGLIGKTAVFCMPGSLKACQLACRQLIFPELGHLTKHIHDG